MNKRRQLIAKSILIFGVLPALVFNLSRFVVSYWFETRDIDMDFIGTSIGSSIVFLLIGYFTGSRAFSRIKGNPSDDAVLNKNL